MALTILTIVSFSHLDDNSICFSDDLSRWKAKLPPGLEMSSLHFTSHTARSWGYTPTFILVKLIYQFEGITEMSFLCFFFFTLKNGFHECSFSLVNPWIHRFAAKGNSKMKKKTKKNVRLSNRQPSRFSLFQHNHFKVKQKSLHTYCYWFSKNCYESCSYSYLLDS